MEPSTPLPDTAAGTAIRTSIEFPFKLFQVKGR